MLSNKYQSLSNGSKSQPIDADYFRSIDLKQKTDLFMKVECGKYACGHFEVTSEEFHDAWDSMMRDWLSESGYECVDRLPYELYYNNREDHPEKKHIVDI